MSDGIRIAAANPAHHKGELESAAAHPLTTGMRWKERISCQDCVSVEFLCEDFVASMPKVK
jgi:hypothetical protein